MTWQTSRFRIALTRPLVMGIVNVTPDSFSDGGRYEQADAARAHCDLLVAQGNGLSFLLNTSPAGASVPAFAAQQALAAGTIPISMIRWEMTGLDNEAKQFWGPEPKPAAKKSTTNP